MARNGRSQGDPWSLRQTGVYQQFCFKRRCSVWILLQPSDDMRARLWKGLSSSQQEINGEHPLLLHLPIFCTAARNWHDYVKHLQARLVELVSTTFETAYNRSYIHPGREGLFLSNRAQVHNRLHHHVLGSARIATASEEIPENRLHSGFYSEHYPRVYRFLLSPRQAWARFSKRAGPGGT